MFLSLFVTWPAESELTDRKTLKKKTDFASGFLLVHHIRLSLPNPLLANVQVVIFSFSYQERGHHVLAAPPPNFLSTLSQLSCSNMMWP